jgi:hypothetical protein
MLRGPFSALSLAAFFLWTGLLSAQSPMQIKCFLEDQSMVKVKHFAAALTFAACAGNVSASYENSVNTTEATAAIAATKDALVTLETSAYEAWKSKDAKFWETSGLSELLREISCAQ